MSDPRGTVTGEEVVDVWVTGSVRWCSPCGGEQVFEVPPCADGHGEECLDLACVECGHALVAGVLVVEHDVLQRAA